MDVRGSRADAHQRQLLWAKRASEDRNGTCSRCTLANTVPQLPPCPCECISVWFKVLVICCGHRRVCGGVGFAGILRSTPTFPFRPRHDDCLATNWLPVTVRSNGRLERRYSMRTRVWKPATAPETRRYMFLVGVKGRHVSSLASGGGSVGIERLARYPCPQPMAASRAWLLP